tara:strand:+ start:1954 stop:2460 length:507 start_codon:yes stop_codon:yes gene_type:complete
LALSGGAVKYHLFSTTLGRAIAVVTDNGLSGLGFADSDAELVDYARQITHAKSHLIETSLSDYVAEIGGWLNEPDYSVDIPLDLQGTPFQRLVWQGICTIPCGLILTYTELAQQIGKPNAVRAVASACGANPVALLVPCHRVVRRDGGLGGYRWGLARKRWLLERERQ